MESGAFTDDFIADLCAVKCTCSGATTTPPDPGDVGGPIAPTNVQATDGAFSTKVVITWNSVTDATSYDILRGDTSDFTTAVSIGTTTGNLSTSFDDNSAASGTTYYYWVRALNGVLRGVLSAPDTGYSVGAITAITALKATKGHQRASTSTKPTISLVFPAVVGATHYDIYRGTTSVFTAGTTSRIDQDRMPFNNKDSIYACSPFPCTKNPFVDNGDELVYIDQTPASNYATYYYWVKAKHLNDSGGVVEISAESNSDTGWSSGDGSGATPAFGSVALTADNQITTVPAGCTRAWFVVVGCGSGGAGATAGFAGGGGGGAAIITGHFTVAPGQPLKATGTLGTGIAAGGASGAGGLGPTPVKLLYDNGGGYVEKVASQAPGQGTYTGTGTGGAGGGGVFSTGGGVDVFQSENGRAGEPANGLTGGRGGQPFGSYRPPPNNHPNIPVPPYNFGLRGDGNYGRGGSGSDAFGGALAVGGNGTNAYILVCFYLT